MNAAATVADAVAAATRALAAAGVPEPRADAEVLVAHALGTSRAGLVAAARDPLAAEAAARVRDLVARRGRRTPLWHLLGRREFWSLDVAVDSRVLTPRPETEMLVEQVRSLAPPGGCVIDAGTGSGAIAAALARERPDLRVIATDHDAAALAVAAANCRRLAPRVALVRADWLTAFAPGAADVVVANPPYVPDTEVQRLVPEIRDHEPRRALAGGPDGLAAIARLVHEAASVVRPGGWLVLEIGAGQADAVRDLAGGPAWRPPLVHPDLAGIPRCVALRRRAPCP